MSLTIVTYLFMLFSCPGSAPLRVFFSRCGEWELLSSCGWGLLIAVASLARAWASVLAARGLSLCGAQAWLLQGMWDLLGSRIKPASPALAGGFFTTEPPGKPKNPY